MAWHGLMVYGLEGHGVAWSDGLWFGRALQACHVASDFKTGPLQLVQRLLSDHDTN